MSRRASHSWRSSARVVAGAARDEPSHAVPDQHELGQRHGPVAHQSFELVGERAPVLADVEPAVVVQIDRRVAEVARQRRAVIVALALPLQVVHAQAVDQHDQLAAGARNRRGQRLAFGRQPHAVPAQAHGDRQRVARCRQVVAEDAVERGERRLAAGPCASLAEQRCKPRQQSVEALAHQPDHTVDAAINQARDAGRPVLPGPADHPRDNCNLVMHRLDEVDDPGDGGDGQPVDPAKIGSSDTRHLDHGDVIVVERVQ